MWIYVPPTYCPSAPEEADSTSACTWRCRMLESSVMWKTKPSPARRWLQRWKRASWIRRLFGRICEPSTAIHGVESWIASLAATRASRSPYPDEKKENMTQGTCGHVSLGLSEKLTPRSSSLRTSLTTFGSDMKLSGESYKKLVIWLNRESLARRKWVQRTLENDCSSSDVSLNTPTEKCAISYVDDTGKPKQATEWLTPSVEDAKLGSREAYLQYLEKGRTTQARLRNQVAFWATPMARDHRSMEVGEKTLNKNSRPLSEQVGVWKSSLQGLKNSKSGIKSSKKFRRLNPLFVCWMMNWPLGWSNPSWRIDQCNFASWEMASSQHVRHLLLEYFSVESDIMRTVGRNNRKTLRPKDTELSPMTGLEFED